MPDFVGGADDADGVRRIGGDEDDVGIECLHRAHDRRVVGRGRRIFLVEDQVEAADLLDALPRAVGGVLGKFGVGGDDRHRLRPRRGRGGELEEAVGEGLLRLGPGRQHREVLVVMESAVGGIGENADGGHLVLHHDRNGGRHHIGRVRPDHQVDFVDVDQLGVELRHVRRIALVVIEHQLDRPPQQPALGVDVVAPDLQRGQHLLADRRHAAGQRHGHADPDRIGGLRHVRRHVRCDQRANGNQRHRTGSSPKAAHMSSPPLFSLWALCGAAFYLKTTLVLLDQAAPDGQLPRNTALRLAWNASTPSRKSSDWRSRL